MSELDLDAIRARCDEVRDGEVSWAGVHNLRSPLKLDETYALLALVDRLKADAIPNGGQWLTYYGDLAYLDDTYRRAEYTHQRHEWHGPVELIARDEVSS